MITRVQFTAVGEPGVLSKIAVALLNKGFRVKKQSSTIPDGEVHSVIKMFLEGTAPITQNELDEVAVQVPDILNVQRLAIVAPEQGQVVDVKKIDKAALLESCMERLDANYPDIYRSLHNIDSELAENVKDEIIGCLGEAFGNKIYASDYADKESLAYREALQQMLLPSLDAFFKIEWQEPQIRLKNFPLCFERNLNHTDCIFITRYIAGFLAAIPEFPIVSVTQTHCKARGNSQCAFNIQKTAA